MTDTPTQLILPNATEDAAQALTTRGDVLYDTDNDVVRVGDGKTPGGRALVDARAMADQVQAARDYAKEQADKAQERVDDLGATVSSWPRGAHPYWAVFFTDFNSPNGIRVGQLGMMEVPGGPDMVSGGTPIGDVLDPAFPPNNAFDGDPNTDWIGPLGGAIGYHFAQPIQINQFTLASGVGDGAGKAGVFKWSDDGQAWSDAIPFAGQTNWRNGEMRAFTDPLYGQASKLVPVVDPVSKRLYAKVDDALVDVTPDDATGGGSGKSANTQALIAALKRGWYPKLSRQLPAIDRPTVSLINVTHGLEQDSQVPNLISTALTSARVRFGLAQPLAGAVGKGAYYGIAQDTGRPSYSTSTFSVTVMSAGFACEIGLENKGNLPARLYVNDCYVGDLILPSALGAYSLVHLAFGSASIRKVQIVTCGWPILRVFSDVALAAFSDPLPLIATNLGDSFVEAVAGINSTPGGYSGAGCSTVMGLACGLDPWAMGVGGTGVFNDAPKEDGTPSGKVNWLDATRLQDLTLEGSGYVPAIGNLFCSINDSAANNQWQRYGTTFQDAYTAALDMIVDTWRAKVPADRSLVIWGPIGADVSGRLDQYRMRDAAAKVATMRRRENVRFIDRLMPAQRVGVYADTGSQDWLYTSGDGVHPDPAGHSFDGLYNARQLRELILTDLD